MFIVILILFASLLNAEEYYMEPVVVTATRTPVEKHSAARNVIVITADDMQNGGFENIDEVLNTLGGIDVQARHQNVQSDISIRGTTFEQNLIMIDGVIVNNPQTGHHNMNLAITLNDIEKIEIMPGHSSSLYGSYGYGGTINIITKKGAKKFFKINLSYGSFNTYKVFDAGDLNVGNNLFLSYSFEKERSDGFIYGTEYDITKLNFSIFYSIEKNQFLKLYYGWIGKDFGAYDFYTPGANFPSKEKIDNHIAYVQFNYNVLNFYVDSKIYYNRAFDYYILTREDPEFYHNKHFVDKYGMELLLSLKIKESIFFSTFFNRNIERIDGSLGDHTRSAWSIGNEILFNYNRVGVNLSSRLDLYDDNKYYSPGIGVYYWMSKAIKIRSSAGSSYRMPSFTELYYKSPSNFGNENLKAGKNNSYEAGIDLYFSKMIFKNTVFYRQEYDFIDWVGYTETGPWYAKNMDKIEFTGIENEFTLFLLKKIKIILRNSAILAETGKDYFSKYGLNYTKNQTSISLYFPILFNINSRVRTVYKIRSDKNFAVTSVYLAKHIFKHFNLFCKAENIFNEQYEEVRGIKQPGRELKAGLELQL